MTVEPARLAHAILTSVIDGSYPDSEDVAGAELTASALPEIVQYLQKAREDVHVSVSPSCSPPTFGATAADAKLTGRHP